ncbi:MAG: M20 family metallopeptidase [Gemella sp.]|nr:M20 family metallopeptidase [Gemella sp.]
MNYKDQVLTYIDEVKEKYINISKEIHAKPEIGNQEFFASKLLKEVLQKSDFEIESNIAGHETGFIALYKSGKRGPNVAFLAEYDALPGLGHACGHNIIGTSSVLAAISLRQVIDEIGGNIYVYGCPAEEGGANGSAKASYVKAGLFKNIDAAMMVHPAWDSYTSLNSLAVDVFEVEFFGKSAHAAANPEEGINALDAMIQFYNGVNALRQQNKVGDMIHGIILDGGQAPNIIPDYTKARFFTRSKRRKDLDILTSRVEKIANGSALQTGCEYKFTFIQNGVDDFNINEVFDDLYKEVALELGDNIVRDLSANFGSTDAGNVSQVVPTIHPFIKIGSSDLVPHTNEFREAANSSKGYEALILSAKIMTLTALRLYSDEEKLLEIKNCFSNSK